MHAHEIDMNLLRVLNVLFEERSVTRTGQRLGRTQSAISNALARLRRHFDDPLLVRGANGLALTPRAEQLVDPLREMMHHAEACLLPGDRFDPGTARGAVSIGAPDRLSLPLMLPMLRRLRAQAPHLAVHLVTCDGRQALEHLDREQVDLAIGWFDRPPAHLRTAPAFREAFAMLCRADHPLAAHPGALDDRELLGHPHLVVSAAGGHLAAFDALLARRGQARRVALSLNSFSIVPQLLRESDLIGVFTRRVAAALARDFALVSVPLEMHFEALEHLVVWHGRNEADPRQQWLRAQVLESCAAL